METDCCGWLQKLFSKRIVLCSLAVSLLLLVLVYVHTSEVEVFRLPSFQSSPLSLKSSLSYYKDRKDSVSLRAQTEVRKNIPQQEDNETDENKLPKNQTGQEKSANRTEILSSLKQNETEPSQTDKSPGKNKTTDAKVDVHLHDPILGHTGKTTGHTHTSNAQIHRNTIAIGGGITSAKISPQATPKEMLQKMPLFNAALPSFCGSCGTNFRYHFYLAYDYNDPLFSNQKQLESFSRLFYEQVKAKCPSTTPVELHMVQCDHTRKPAWAQNDAMMEAYIDNMEYFYRINDDSKLDYSPWPTLFTERLKKYSPPNLGVVGPNHRGGNVAILTYDFTHHTHQDMFGFHYPRDFTDWYGDDWITGIYKPGRVEKLKQVSLVHTMQLGQRYTNHMDGKKLAPRFKVDKALLERYAKYLNTKDSIKKDPSKVIAISLYDIHPKQTIGALRNVQQAPVYFPEWTVRIYTPSPTITDDPVPERLLNKMETLGAEIYVLEKLHYPKESVAYHVFQDDSVQTVLFRDPEFRLSDRQKAAVDEWMSSSAAMHCMRDHSSHVAQPIVPGLFGIKLNTIRDKPELNEKLTNILEEELNKKSERSLEKRLWHEFEKDFLCHDSISCDTWANSKAFPVRPLESNPTHEGQRFDEHMVTVLQYKYNPSDHKCT